MFNVIFDMDGVIFDSERAQFDCWIEVSAKYGLDEAEIEFIETHVKEME